MSNNFEALGIDKAVYDEAEAQEVSEGYKPLPSGVYKSKIKELAIFNTDKGAGMLKVTVSPVNPDESLTDVTVYQNIKKKDGSANEIGTRTLKNVLEALNTSLDQVAVQNAEIVGYAKNVQAKVISGIQNTMFLACIRQVHEEGAKYSDYNEIAAYAKADGTNAKGENIIDAFKAKIEKNPILERKAKNTQSSSAGTVTANTEKLKDLL